LNLGKSFFILATFVVTLLQGLTLNAAECRVESGKNRTALLELYTSEGCSSCPPADKWLSQLTKLGIGTDKLIPLSLHVDYWNYIGWKDPYSAAEYTQRQRQVAQRNRLRSIYTPQMVFNGRDYRGWRGKNIKKLLNEVNAWPAAAKITVNWQPRSDKNITATIASELLGKKDASSKLFVALYENNLVSNVTAGENDGRSLQHDYVVRKMFAISFLGEKNLSKQITMQIQPDWNKNNLGIAVFVQQSSDGAILQALASPVNCGS